MQHYKEHIANRIQEEHDHLRFLMESVSQSLAQPPMQDFAEWKLEQVWALRDFRNVLAKHFDLEEDGGFMADIIDTAPREKRKVDQLHLEHAEFLNEVESITVELKRTPGFSEVRLLRDRMTELLSGFRNHEALERDLIGFVYSQDLGLGD